MKINTMRRIDHLAGVPLCFAATLLVRLAGFFRESKPARPKNVLFVELSEMGSAILADPAMRKIQHERDAELHFVIFKSNVGGLFLSLITIGWGLHSPYAARMTGLLERWGGPILNALGRLPGLGRISLFSKQ